jgi:TonB family protein
MDAVSPILMERAREPQGLRNMFVVSLVIHAIVAAVIVIAPRPALEAPPTTVMTISLGAGQVNNGGLTSIAGKAAEAARPDEKPVTAAPAPKPAEMVLPTRKTKAPPATQKKTADDAKSKLVAKAAKASEGDARIDTGANRVGFGLSTGGGGGTSGYLDVQNFRCPEYLGTMNQLIQKNWNGRIGTPGAALIKFRIERDGRLTGIELERSSGYFALDQGAQRALMVTKQLPPLPTAFPEPALTVHLTFQYER